MSENLNRFEVHYVPDSENVEETWLCCPCGAPEGLHHTFVEVFNPAKERGEDGLHVRVNGLELSHDNRMGENPSAFREGILIGFWCEICLGTATLAISQHKGTEKCFWVQYEENSFDPEQDTGSYH